MKILVFLASLAVFVAAATAQNQPSATGAGSATVQTGPTSAGANAATSTQSGQTSATAGATIEAELTKGIDSKKSKPGDPVVAKCTKEEKGNGDFRIPKNAKLIGHLTEVQVRGKGQSESTLGIAFDKALLKDGREIPLKAMIQAIAASPSVAMAMDNSTAANSSAGSGGAEMQNGGGALGGVNSSVNSAAANATGVAGKAVGNVASTAGNVGSQASAATNDSLRSASHISLNGATSGVIGLKGLQLDTAAFNATQGSVIRSSTDNVRLDSGTRLVLRLITQ
jgi:hypothetical protein